MNPLVFALFLAALAIPLGAIVWMFIALWRNGREQRQLMRRNFPDMR